MMENYATVSGEADVNAFILFSDSMFIKTYFAKESLKDKLASLNIGLQEIQEKRLPVLLSWVDTTNSREREIRGSINKWKEKITRIGEKLARDEVDEINSMLARPGAEQIRATAGHSFGLPDGSDGTLLHGTPWELMKARFPPPSSRREARFPPPSYRRGETKEGGKRKTRLRKRTRKKRRKSRKKRCKSIRKKRRRKTRRKKRKSKTIRRK